MFIDDKKLTKYKCAMETRTVKSEMNPTGIESELELLRKENHR